MGSPEDQIWDRGYRAGYTRRVVDGNKIKFDSGSDDVTASDMYKVGDLIFVMTCDACPEQYDVFNSDGDEVGYVRLRWGTLTANYQGPYGPVIFGSHIYGDWDGCFPNDEERNKYLGLIAKLLVLEVDKHADW